MRYWAVNVLMVRGCFGLSVRRMAIFWPRYSLRFCIVLASRDSVGYGSAFSRFCVQDIMAVTVSVSVSTVLRVPTISSHGCSFTSFRFDSSICSMSLVIA